MCLNKINWPVNGLEVSPKVSMSPDNICLYALNDATKI